MRVQQHEHPGKDVSRTALPSHYNERLARYGEGRAFLDRRTARFEHETGTVEICDVLTPERQFVHVKPETSSAALSDLFGQGVCVGAPVSPGSRVFVPSFDDCWPHTRVSLPSCPRLDRYPSVRGRVRHRDIRRATDRADASILRQELSRARRPGHRVDGVPRNACQRRGAARRAPLRRWPTVSRSYPRSPAVRTSPKFSAEPPSSADGPRDRDAGRGGAPDHRVAPVRRLLAECLTDGSRALTKLRVRAVERAVADRRLVPADAERRGQAVVQIVVSYPRRQC